MLGRKLKVLLKSANCKQLDLARHLDISPSRLSNYLSDKREPSFDMLVEIAKFLNVDMNFFADTTFSKKVGRNASVVSDNTATYNVANRDEIVDVPIMPVNAKKHSMKTTTIPFSKVFLTECDEPEKQFVIFEVNSAMPAEYAQEGDYILCAKCENMPLEDGDFLFENGRNTKYYRYYKHGDTIMLINEYDKSEHVIISNESELNSYFKVLWKVSKFR